MPATSTPAVEDLALRVMGEFDEMPSLRLTLEQAMRLWALDRATCLCVLNSLVESQCLVRDRSGRYVRYHIDY